MLGLTQQQMAERIGVTYQQTRTYERGVNRVAAGRLYTIAQVLGAEVGFFFDGIDEVQVFRPSPKQRVLLELARSFINMPNRQYQDALCNLARVLAKPELVESLEEAGNLPSW